MEIKEVYLANNHTAHMAAIDFTRIVLAIQSRKFIALILLWKRKGKRIILYSFLSHSNYRERSWKYANFVLYFRILLLS